MDKYKGVVIEESLEDNRAINGLIIVDVHITEQEDPTERWHLYTVMVNEEEIVKDFKIRDAIYV